MEIAQGSVPREVPQPVAVEQTVVSAKERTKVLLVEDNPEYAVLVERAFTSARPAMELKRVESLGEALEAVRASDAQGWKPDAILLDLSLPDSEPETTIFHARGLARRAPLFVLTALCDRAAALQALACGVDDYFVKEQVDPRSLVREVRHALGRREAGGPNPLGSCESPAEFREELRERCSSGEPFALTVVELDHFETLRDLWGDPWAYRMLRSAADVLRRTLGEHDVLARLGESSFGIIHPRDRLSSDIAGAAASAMPADVSHRELFSATAHCGTAWFPEDGAHPATLLSRAEARCRQPFERDGIDLRIRLEPGEPPREL